MNTKSNRQAITTHNTTRFYMVQLFAYIHGKKTTSFHSSFSILLLLLEGLGLQLKIIYIIPALVQMTKGHWNPKTRFWLSQSNRLGWPRHNPTLTFNPLKKKNIREVSKKFSHLNGIYAESVRLNQIASSIRFQKLWQRFKFLCITAENHGRGFQTCFQANSY